MVGKGRPQDRDFGHVGRQLGKRFIVTIGRKFVHGVVHVIGFCLQLFTAKHLAIFNPRFLNRRSWARTPSGVPTFETPVESCGTGVFCFHVFFTFILSINISSPAQNPVASLFSRLCSLSGNNPSGKFLATCLVFRATPCPFNEIMSDIARSLFRGNLIVVQRKLFSRRSESTKRLCARVQLMRALAIRI